MAVQGDTLWVADTENHALRQVDLVAKTVKTIAGTGTQARGRGPGGEGVATELNSPWDVLLADEKLFIAMAGSHQIWTYDLKTLRAEPFAGSGREDIADGPAVVAELAQPSGLATDGTNLYFADSEVSAVRAIPLKGGAVTTLIGKGLFEFGDQDGPVETARLQHPLGLAWHGGKLYVADTYNHRIKAIDLENKTIKAVFGTGKPGRTNGTKASFREPGGICAVAGKLYVADTNNHVIRVADLKTGNVWNLKLSGL
jgi:DNA-binding beta-propeller fold protein YncE